MGYVMSGTSVALLVGPSLGGWLYAIGGIELPFVFVGVMLASLCAAGFLLIRAGARGREPGAIGVDGHAGARRRRMRGLRGRHRARRSRCSNRCCRSSSTGGSA